MLQNVKLASRRRADLDAVEAKLVALALALAGEMSRAWVAVADLKPCLLRFPFRRRLMDVFMRKPHVARRRFPFVCLMAFFTSQAPSFPSQSRISALQLSRYAYKKSSC